MSQALERTPGRDDDAADGIEEADLYEMLGNSRRRHALRYLREHSTPASVGELAEYVAAVENGVPVEEVTPEQRKSAYTALYQNHLGKLVDAGLVRADRRWVGIELTEAAAELDFGFEERTRDGPARDWGRYAAVLSGAGVAVAAAVVLGVVSPRLPVATAFGLLFFLLFVLSVRSLHRPA